MLKKTERILVTGGAGYIGSHAVLSLLELGHNVVVLDNFSNSSRLSLERISMIAGRSPEIIEGDIRDSNCLSSIFENKGIEVVMHFAGLKSVGESARRPLDYYKNNLAGTLQLCRTMSDFDVFRLIFSSSATVYGEPAKVPVGEDCPRGAQANPYGRSKLMTEQVLEDLVQSDSRWGVALLRYFNPVGAHSSGLIGESPTGIPNNLMPYVSQVAIGKLKELSIYGADYPTHDGTGIRDYIHVTDLVEGHMKALEYVSRQTGLGVWNLGTGRGYSVLEIVKMYEEISGRHIPYRFAPRRPGDVAECWADPEKALVELGWRATRGLRAMVADSWRWQVKNPNGYESTSPLPQLEGERDWLPSR